MTPERKNEIWAMLDSQCQNIAKDCYLMGNPKVAWAIEQFFGTHNLTAQAEEATQESPSEQKFYVGQKVIVTDANSNPLIPKGTIGIVAKVQTEPCEAYFVTSENCDYSYFSILPQCLALYTEPNSQDEQTIFSNAQNSENPTENVISDGVYSSEMTKSGETHVDYAAYRLDLAREIAVKMIDDPGNYYSDIPARAVRITNEIVKRLKETEE